MKVVTHKGDIQEFRPLLELWGSLAKTAGFKLGMDAESVLFDLAQMVRSDCSDILTLRSDKDALLGFIGVTTLPSPLDRKPVCNEHFFYVIPAHRGPGGVKLIRAAETWAKERGCSAILLTASKLASARHDRVERLYTRLQYKPFESVFIKEF
jgi:GNAT superfamily N-acetyltransferase